jgi:hypothetical protein
MITTEDQPMTNSIFNTCRSEILGDQAMHELVLHLLNPSAWPLDLDAHLGTLGQKRELADAMIESYDRHGQADPAFALLASSIETATRNFKRNHES